MCFLSGQELLLQWHIMKRQKIDVAIWKDSTGMRRRTNLWPFKQQSHPAGTISQSRHAHAHAHISVATRGTKMFPFLIYFFKKLMTLLSHWLSCPKLRTAQEAGDPSQKGFYGGRCMYCTGLYEKK